MAILKGIVNRVFGFTIIHALILFYWLEFAEGNCWQDGEHPLLPAAPKIIQLTATKVKVSWASIINQEECADYFLVRYWISASPNNYLESDLPLSNANHVILEGIVPGVSYTYEVRAVQRKGVTNHTNISGKVTFTAKNNYCWEDDMWAEFTAPPNITQVTPTVVQVSWIASRQECADMRCVKYWKSSLETNLI